MESVSHDEKELMPVLLHTNSVFWCTTLLVVMQQPLDAQVAQDDDDLSTRPLSITGPYGAITPDPHLVPPLRLHPLLSSSPPSPWATTPSFWL